MACIFSVMKSGGSESESVRKVASGILERIEHSNAPAGMPASVVHMD
jgi:hypothetical protein